MAFSKQLREAWNAKVIRPPMFVAIKKLAQVKIALKLWKT